MPRDYDIPYAFTLAITPNARGVQVVATSVFRRELHKLNHDWTLQRCNEWIISRQTFFADITEGDSVDGTYALRNMGRVL
ncbi:hypothetical protein ACQWYE_003050 [Escherichia coli]|nr:hypothetical protein [Escherichia coli]KXL12038.1 hypothetical protein AXH13_14735 [Escherichia coli]PSF61905.1 hypothetical protein C6981_11800 [Escherichia coli]HAJ3429017.1 hypothetical protein [Escherichia coli]HBI9595867.1 hypothetical protein [Escherichia coli]